MNTKTFLELKTLKRQWEREVKEIEANHLQVIKRYWDLKDKLSRLTPYLNKAMIREQEKES